MASNVYALLKRFEEVCKAMPALDHLKVRLAELNSISSGQDTIDELIKVYEKAISIVNEAIRSSGLDETQIDVYQRLFRQLEELITFNGNDSRHKFIVVIPVADRPKHLHSCLQSLLILCQSFHYGGYLNHKFAKVAVIIADDTKEPANILKNQEIVRHFNTQGLEVIYFGQDEQWEQLERLSKTNRRQLANIVGNLDRAKLYHKGPSLMRNITYLKLNELRKQEKNLLYYFIDSDQEFRITVQSDKKDKSIYAINYFYELDNIFRHKNVNVLTGKVVGDPPVSPAVMAGTFLDDVTNFLNRIATTAADAPCQFHRPGQQKEYDAAYHDMAELFGFKSTGEAYEYRCPLTGKHDHTKCFSDFAGKLNQFFHGEHPTRKSYFNPQEAVTDIKPARTIYTGNYVFDNDGLKYFIPFAGLKLRMAGPTLGRIIKSDINDRFVSANLPMLHNRTVDDTGKSEFRPGIHSEADKIDLSGEFERQYFGDVMLFCMEKLTTLGYPEQPLSKQTISETLQVTDKEMRQKYATKQQQIQQKLTLLKSIFTDSKQWWNTDAALQSARDDFIRFIRNIEQNFSAASRCYELIGSETNRTRRLQEMLTAISEYPADQRAWMSAIGVRDREN